MVTLGSELTPAMKLALAIAWRDRRVLNGNNPRPGGGVDAVPATVVCALVRRGLLLASSDGGLLPAHLVGTWRLDRDEVADGSNPALGLKGVRLFHLSRGGHPETAIVKLTSDARVGLIEYRHPVSETAALACAYRAAAEVADDVERRLLAADPRPFEPVDILRELKVYQTSSLYDHPRRAVVKLFAAPIEVVAAIVCLFGPALATAVEGTGVAA